MAKHRADEPEQLAPAIAARPLTGVGQRRDRRHNVTGISGSKFVGAAFTGDEVAVAVFPIVEDLSSISADDQLLDSIAAGRGGFELSAGLAPLLATWRAELVAPPLPALPTLLQVERVMSGPPRRSAPRSLRPILGAAVGIGALLIGSAAVGAHSALPGQPLWALSQVLYSSHAQAVEADVANSAAVVRFKKSVADAKAALVDGNEREAEEALNSASLQLNKVAPDYQGRQQLTAVLSQLTGQVKQSAVAVSQVSVPTPATVASTSASIEAAAVNVAPIGSVAPRATTVGSTTAAGPTPAPVWLPPIPVVPAPGTTSNPVSTTPVTPPVWWPTTAQSSAPSTVVPTTVSSADPVTTAPTTVALVTTTVTTTVTSIPTTSGSMTSSDTPTPTESSSSTVTTAASSTDVPSSEPDVSGSGSTSTSTTSQLPTPSQTDDTSTGDLAIQGTDETVSTTATAGP